MNYKTDEEGKSQILTSAVMSYHTILRNSKDYYEALRFARVIADNLTKTMDIPGVEVFPYSIFYVFFEQYLTIWFDTLTSLAYSLLLVFIVSFILTGLNLGSAFLIVVIVFMILVHMGLLMYVWNISLNAVSLVNLVMVSKFPTIDFQN